MAQRTIVIGDIHGGLRALEQMPGRVGWQPDDRLIFLGDYVDGWSQSAQVIRFLMTLEQTHNCIFIRGNHDTWCEAWLRGDAPERIWLLSGGEATMASYAGISNEERMAHLAFFNRLRNYFIDRSNASIFTPASHLCMGRKESATIATSAGTAPFGKWPLPQTLILRRPISGILKGCSGLKKYSSATRPLCTTTKQRRCRAATFGIRTPALHFTAGFPRWMPTRSSGGKAISCNNFTLAEKGRNP